jgi:hypothetical protein
MICIKCNQPTNRKSDTCKKCYYKDYHLKTFKKKITSCALCGEVSDLGRKKYCDQCREKIPSICCDCGKEFFYKAKYKRCTTCQYHYFKENNFEKHTEIYSKRNDRKKEERRIDKGLPVDHVFFKGLRGEGYLNKSGYRVMVWKDEETEKYKRKYKHVLVMQEHLGRELAKNESVHHKNGQRDDNRIENLELWSKAQPAGQRVEDKVKWCIEFLNQYGYKVV